jgi:Carboxypeptidase regulatory-like domain/TonB dependent receptor
VIQPIRRSATALLAVVALCVLASSATTPIHAQILYGSIVGNVTDAQGAVVPAAMVTVTHKETNLIRETTTNEQGVYTLANAVPGTYDVKVSLSGFREFIKTSVPVAAGQISRVDVKLDLGALTETVTVQSEAQLLQTDKSEVRSVLRAAEITNLPLNQYRNYQALINLVPGAMPATFQNDQTDTPGRALRTQVNGMNPNNNNTRLDGASSVNIWLPHHVGYVAPAETIETVNISTNNFDAGSGMAGGAAVTLITKSGTNDLKGSGFFFRNQDELNARSFFDSRKAPSSITIGGGTLGGPMVKNKAFYFGSWEGNYERRGAFSLLNVPTAKMRNGDFSEVLTINPNFRLFDPFTGNPDGTGRTEFAGAIIPANRIAEVAKRIQALYPAPNVPGTNNGLQNNYEEPRNPVADRDNYDLKLNWNRTAAHQVFWKFSTMQAQVENLFFLGSSSEGGIGDTNNYLTTFGHTWTLSPTMLLDGNFGVNWQDQWAHAADFGTNYGSDNLGLPGTNGPDERQSGMPSFATGMSTVGNPTTWHPVTRYERSFTFTQNLTKLAGKHEFRAGFDFIHYHLDHWQPELGRGPRGQFDFSGNVTGQPGYVSNAWNQYAGFLLGRTSGYGKSIQFEEMTGREQQFAWFGSDRWNVNEKTTINLGLRYEYYPIMTRANGRGLERLDYSTWEVLLGGVGGIPKDVGLKPSKTLFAPRLGISYRIDEKTVARAGYGQTFNPLPWSRPLRGFYPLTIGFSETAAGVFGSNFASFDLARGIPEVPIPTITGGRLPLPRNVQTRTPVVGEVERGRTHQFNVMLERQIPYDISVSVGYVGTRYYDGYADQNLNYSEGGGDAGRQFFAQAGTADILDWSARTKTKYDSLQVAINRPFKAGLLLKGAYTLGEALNETDEDGWATLTWSQPSQLHRNFATAGYDRRHNFQMGFVYQLPFAKGSSDPLALVIKDWQVNGIFSAYSGLPFTVGGDNTALNQRQGSQTIDLIAPLRRVGDPGPDEVYYDPSSFAQPGAKWGNTERNQFRAPPVWNLDFSVFRLFPIGRYHAEFRAEAANVMNHTQWGIPVTGFTDPNFMRIRALSNTYNPRRIQLGVRFQF